MNTKKRQSLVRTEDFIKRLTVTKIEDKARINSICRNEKRHLGEGKSDSELEANGQQKKIAMTTYRRYITSYRNAIKELNLIHPDARKNIKSIKEKYPKYSELLNTLDAELPQLRDSVKNALIVLKSKNTHLYGRIKRLKIEHPAFYYMRTSDSVKDRYKDYADEHLTEKHTSIITVYKSQVHQIIEDCLTDTQADYETIAVGLSLATGRRAIEILKLGAFKKSSKNYLIFSGQAKTKGSNAAQDNYKIPVLADTKIIQEAFNRLRDQINKATYSDIPFKDLSNTDVNQMTAHKMNKEVKRLFSDEERTFKDCRAIYAIMAKELFMQPKKHTEEQFYSMILGHSEDDKSTQLSYKGFITTEEQAPQAQPLDKPEAKQATLLSDIEKHDIAIVNCRSKAIRALHEWVKDEIKKDQDINITQTYITKNKGGGRETIKKYLRLVDLID